MERTNDKLPKASFHYSLLSAGLAPVEAAIGWLLRAHQPTNCDPIGTSPMKIASAWRRVW